jgi:hypothetical protein
MNGEGDYAASLAAMHTKEVIVGAVGLFVALAILYLLLIYGVRGWHKLHEVWPKVIPDTPDLGI